jgi:hypothetical protein
MFYARINKMKKTILLVCTAIWIMAAGCTKESGTMGPLTWTLKKNGTLTISGIGNMSFYNPYDYDPQATQLYWYPYRANIQTVNIKEGVTSISLNAFADCSSLTSISIPNSVTSIGYWAFDYCSGLKKIIVKWEQPLDISSFGPFERISGNCILEVPQGTKVLYENTEEWKDFAPNIVESTGSPVNVIPEDK